MEIVSGVEKITGGKACSLALGAFDGLHRGHMAVIHGSAAPGLHMEQWENAVFTFNESPSGSRALVTRRDRIKLLEGAGVNRLYLVDFQDIRNMEAEDFFHELLIKSCNAKRLCCGEDFRFGKGARGDVALLKRLCDENNIQLFIAPQVTEKGKKVSSTEIRSAVEAGDIPRANKLLGRPFGFSLEVIHGNHIGTGLGTPTINQALPGNFVLPKFGVYASWARVGGKFFYGVTNIGVKPTVGSDKVLSETWLPDFSGDLYGKRVRLFLLDFIRAEKKFNSLQELKEEIGRNAAKAKTIAKGCPPPSFGL